MGRDSHPHERAFLFRGLLVSPLALLLEARAFASTGLTFPEPQGSFSVLIDHLGLGTLPGGQVTSPRKQKKESVQWSHTETFLPKEPIYLGTPKHFSVVNVLRAL